MRKTLDLGIYGKQQNQNIEKKRKFRQKLYHYDKDYSQLF
jgi:hypothetical protein